MEDEQKQPNIIATCVDVTFTGYAMMTRESNPIIWQDRLCKVVDGVTIFMSAVGDYDNFNFGAEIGPEIACAMNVGMPPLRLKALIPLDDERLLIVTELDRLWTIVGNPCDGGRIDRGFTLSTAPAPAAPRQPAASQADSASPGSEAGRQ